MKGNLQETVAHYNDSFATAILVFVEDTTIGLLDFLFWIFILMRASRPLRTTSKGTTRDNSLWVIATVVSLALLCTIMTMGIYLDIKFAIFGAFKGSIIQAIFS